MSKTASAAVENPALAREALDMVDSALRMQRILVTMLEETSKESAACQLATEVMVDLSAAHDDLLLFCGLEA